MIKSNKSVTETVFKYIFTFCGITAILAVAVISFYMLLQGLPALFKVGFGKILFSNTWEPAAKTPSYGILNIILTSIAGTFFAVLIGVPIGVLTAVFLAETAPKKVAVIIRPAIELLAGIPSVIYGLIGIMVLSPLVYKLEMFIFKGSENHQFTGGSNMLSAVLILAMMILPTVINISESALRALDPKLKYASLALGASNEQTIFKVLLPAARSGIGAAVVLGVGRAIGEAMAITLASGNAANVPLPFNSVKFLTTAIVSEMGYASGTHREVLFTIGLVLFVFIMIVNSVLGRILKKGAENNEA